MISRSARGDTLKYQNRITKDREMVINEKQIVPRKFRYTACTVNVCRELNRSAEEGTNSKDLLCSVSEMAIFQALKYAWSLVMCTLYDINSLAFV